MKLFSINGPLPGGESWRGALYPFTFLLFYLLKSPGANTGAMIMLLMFAPWLYVFKVAHGYVMLTVYKFLL